MEYVKRNALVIVLLALTGWNTMQILETKDTSEFTLVRLNDVIWNQVVQHPELAEQGSGMKFTERY